MVDIVIVGASGLVGNEIINLLNNNYVSFNRLRLISKSSIGEKVIVNGNEYITEEYTIDSFKGFDIVLLCVDKEISKEYSKIALDSGCTVIDASTEFRMNSDVPLIVPEVNIDDINGSKLISNPNCCTILLSMILYQISKLSNIKEVTVSTYQSASGAGYRGINELISQSNEFVKSMNNPHYDTNIFGKQYLWNVFSHNSDIDNTTRYNDEELKIVNETKKILGNYDLDISATCVRVPVLRSHSESISITLEDSVELSKIIEVLSNFSGVRILDDIENNNFPEPIISSNQKDVYVGRIRHRIGDKTNTRYELFISGDQLLKGCALNMLQICNIMDTKFSI